MVPSEHDQEHLEMNGKPKSYILVKSNGTAADPEAAHSTPSDSRSICDTPDFDPWTIPELKTAVGPAWKVMCYFVLLRFFKQKKTVEILESLDDN